MSKDPIERQYAALGNKVETLPTPEQFARMHKNVDIGGGGRMEDAVLCIRYQNPFDILHEGYFDKDYSSAVNRFRAAHLSFSAQMGSHHGKLNDSSRDEPTGMALDELYSKLMRQLSRKRFKVLQMLIEPLPDGATPDVIMAYRHYLYPQVTSAEDAIVALETAMEAIAKEEKRKAEVAEREAELNAKWIAMNHKPTPHGELYGE